MPLYEFFLSIIGRLIHLLTRCRLLILLSFLLVVASGAPPPDATSSGLRRLYVQWYKSHFLALVHRILGMGCLEEV